MLWHESAGCVAFVRPELLAGDGPLLPFFHGGNSPFCGNSRERLAFQDFFSRISCACRVRIPLCGKFAYVLRILQVHGRRSCIHAIVPLSARSLGAHGHFLQGTYKGLDNRFYRGLDGGRVAFVSRRRWLDAKLSGVPAGVLVIYKLCHLHGDGKPHQPTDGLRENDFLRHLFLPMFFVALFRDAWLWVSTGFYAGKFVGLGPLEPVTAVTIGVTVFGETLTTRIIAGIALILGSTMLVAVKK